MIYFIQDSATLDVKIGYTAEDADVRRKALQTGNPSELVILATMPGSQKDETELKRRFAAWCVRGEWFRPAPPLLKLIMAAAALREGERLTAPADVEMSLAELRALVRQAGEASEKAFRRGYQHGFLAATRGQATRLDVAKFRNGDLSVTQSPPGFRPAPEVPSHRRLGMEVPHDSLLGRLILLCKASGEAAQ